MIKKFPVEQNILDGVQDDLLKELDRLNTIRGYLVDLIPYDGSKLSVFLENEFHDLGDRYRLISSVLDSLKVIRLAEVVEVVEVVGRTEKECINYLVDYVFVSAECVGETKDGFLFNGYDEFDSWDIKKVKVFKDMSINLSDYETLKGGE
jgi:hypothetical protein